MIAILHNIRSAHNVGSFFRTADAAGVKKLYLSGITPAPIDERGNPSDKIRKVALGAEKFVSWEKVKSTARLIDKLKKDGCTVFAVEQNKKAIPYYMEQKGKRRMSDVVFVMGDEVRGLPESVMEKAHAVLEIPMRGKKESLNVSVAFGIIVFHFTRKRR